MATLTANQARLLTEEMSRIIFNKYGELPMVSQQIFNVDSSRKNVESHSSVTGLQVAVVKEESESTFYDDPIQGFRKDYTHVTYSIGVRISKEMLDDDLFGPMKKMAGAIGRSMREAVEIVAADYFNNGFSDTALGADSIVPFATNHTLVGGGTEQNTLTVAADLTVTSLQQSINDFEDFVDDRGLQLAIKPRLLLGPNELKWQMAQILDSANLPGSANNDINQLNREGLTWMDWVRLTDPDAFFLLAAPGEHELNFFWRERMNTMSEVDFDSDDFKQKARLRFSIGSSDFRGLYGVPGA